MNTTYRSIWNAALGAWVAVSEITRACGKRSVGAVTLTLALACSPAGAQSVSIDGGASETVPGTQSNPWNVAGNLTVGNTGQGTLTVNAGGTVSNTTGFLGYVSAGIGNATVTGAGSTWTNSGDLKVGNNGAGTLTVQDGGTVSSNAGAIGNASGSTGNATVTGANSIWANSFALEVGRIGTGTLTVQNGGTVSNTSGIIGNASGSTGNATVTGAGSIWTNRRALEVGSGSTGTLTVQGGGTVSNTVGYIGSLVGAIGNATVAGAGSTWTNSGTLYVGLNGTGRLTIANGGHVSVGNGTGSLNVAFNSGSTGVLNIGAAVGSAAQAAGTVAAGALRFGAGTGSLNFNHTDAAYVFGTSITGAGVLNQVAGTTILTGVNTYTGATTISAGTLQVGNGGTTGTLGSGAVQVGTGAALSFNRSNNLVVGNAISGGGGVSQNGGGTTLLTGANTYSGATTVSAGTLQVGNGGTTGTLGSAAVQVGTGAALSFNRSDNIAVGNNINGAGGVRQDSGGTLTLAGNNTFSGGLAVNAGSVAASAASALGTGNITLGGGQLTSTTSMTVANALSVSGGTTGTVAAAAGTTLSISASINLAASSTLRVGDAVNNGVVTLSGPGVVAVPSANLLVAGGTLRAGSAALGSITSSVASTTINAGATLDFSGPNLSSVVNNLQGAGTLRHDGGVVGINGGAFSGNLVGTMALVKQGTGTLALSGANTYSGGTSVSGGTLQGNATTLQGNINNNAAVTFDQAATDTYAGVMSGTGALTKQGAGNLILSGTNSYSGATNVNAGTLSANGSIANSAVTVNSGGTLGGNGTLGSTTIATGGVLAPGNSIGTLTVNGNLNFAAGSIYRVEVDAAGANDRINATGTATLNGGTVDVQAGAGTYAANRTYTILNAAAGRTGNFAGVTSNLAFLTPTLGYDANNVFLTLARNDVSFSAVAVTPNQIATSTALQNANGDATGDMSTVQTALTGLSAAQARAAYDSASGTGLVALRSTGASFAAGFGNQLQARLAAVGGANTQVGAFAGGPILLAANDRVSDLMAPVSDSPQKFSLAGGASSSSSSASSEGRGFWLRGSGGHQNTKSDSNAAASELRNSGISAGFDAELREGLVVGAALSSGTSRLGFDNNDTGKSSGSALAVYGSYASGLWAFKGSASAAWNSNHMNRAVTVGALNRTASSDFGSNTLSAYGEASYSLPMNGWTLQPLAALSLSRSKTDGFTETGAGALNLQVAGQTVTSTKSLLGAKASFDAGSVRLEPRVIWAHEFGDINTPMTAHFQGAATASPFQVSGVAPKRDTLILGLGASGRVGHGVDLFADVQFEHNQRQRNLSALMGVRVRW